MSFNTYAKRVLNSQLPLPVRRSALKSCIQRFTRLSKESYGGVSARYEARFHCTGKHSTEDQLLAALSALVIERNLALENLREFEQERVGEKMRGRRTLSNARRKQLKEIASGVLK